ncbi:MAG: hypothetical protein WCG51_06885, partial [Elusimicrobiota bacterium]
AKRESNWAVRAFADSVAYDDQIVQSVTPVTLQELDNRVLERGEQWKDAALVLAHVRLTDADPAQRTAARDLLLELLTGGVPVKIVFPVASFGRMSAADISNILNRAADKEGKDRSWTIEKVLAALIPEEKKDAALVSYNDAVKNYGGSYVAGLPLSEVISGKVSSMRAVAEKDKTTDDLTLVMKDLGYADADALRVATDNAAWAVFGTPAPKGVASPLTIRGAAFATNLSAIVHPHDVASGERLVGTARDQYFSDIRTSLQMLTHFGLLTGADFESLSSGDERVFALQIARYCAINDIPLSFLNGLTGVAPLMDRFGVDDRTLAGMARVAMRTGYPPEVLAAARTQGVTLPPVIFILAASVVAKTLKKGDPLRKFLAQYQELGETVSQAVNGVLADKDTSAMIVKDVKSISAMNISGFWRVIDSMGPKSVADRRIMAGALLSMVVPQLVGDDRDMVLTQLETIIKPIASVGRRAISSYIGMGVQSSRERMRFAVRGTVGWVRWFLLQIPLSDHSMFASLDSYIAFMNVRGVSVRDAVRKMSPGLADYVSDTTMPATIGRSIETAILDRADVSDATGTTASTEKANVARNKAIAKALSALVLLRNIGVPLSATALSRVGRIAVTHTAEIPIALRMDALLLLGAVASAGGEEGRIALRILLD